MAMKATTVRFSDATYSNMERAAEEDGIAVSQLVRESVITYLAWRRGLHQTLDLQAAKEIERLIKRLNLRAAQPPDE